MYDKMTESEKELEEERLNELIEDHTDVIKQKQEELTDYYGELQKLIKSYGR